MIEIKTTAEIARSQGVKVLVYAMSGIGKTCLVATAPKPILISAESGTLSLAPTNLKRIFGEELKGIASDIPVIQVTTIEQLQAAYEWCRDNAKTYGIETICLDSISEIAEVILSNSKKTIKDGRQVYSDMNDKMTQVIRSFRDLQGFNVYMAAKQASIDDAGVPKRGPSMPGQSLKNDTPYFFDEVLRLDVGIDAEGNKFRYLQTQPDLQSIAKDRSGALEQFETPNLTHIFTKIQQGM